MDFDWAGWTSKLKDIEFQPIYRDSNTLIYARVVVTNVFSEAQDQNSLAALQNGAKDRGLFLFLDPRHPKVPVILGELWYVLDAK